MSKAKVDLTVLKRLVSELEIQLDDANVITEGSLTKDAMVDYTVEMSKASGLAAGVMKEAGMLVMDIESLVSGSAGNSANKDMLSKLMQGTKGPGIVN
jgi:hypothetical protein